MSVIRVEYRVFMPSKHLTLPCRYVCFSLVRIEFYFAEEINEGRVQLPGYALKRRVQLYQLRPIGFSICGPMCRSFALDPLFVMPNSCGPKLRAHPGHMKAPLGAWKNGLS